MSGLIGHRGLLMQPTGTPAYLDSLATVPIAVWSLEKLISTATNAIRVRRSNDNAEQDIGFSGDALDTASLASFVGANSAFVTTFYDQTGNSYPLTMATANRQPRIVNAGAYDGFALFDGSNDGMASPTLTLGTPRIGLFTRIYQPTSNVVKMVAELTTDYSAGAGNAQSFALYEYSTQSGLVMASRNNSTPVRATSFANADSALVQRTFLWDRTLTGTDQTKCWLTGVQQTVAATPGTNAQTGNYDNDALYVGSRSGGTLPSTLRLFSMALYTADTASLRSTIEGIVA